MVIECLEIRLDLSRKIYFDMTKLECKNLIFLENRDIIFIQGWERNPQIRDWCQRLASLPSKQMGPVRIRYLGPWVRRQALKVRWRQYRPHQWNTRRTNSAVAQGTTKPRLCNSIEDAWDWNCSPNSFPFLNLPTWRNWQRNWFVISRLQVRLLLSAP